EPGFLSTDDVSLFEADGGIEHHRFREPDGVSEFAQQLPCRFEDRQRLPVERHFEEGDGAGVERLADLEIAEGKQSIEGGSEVGGFERLRISAEVTERVRALLPAISRADVDRRNVERAGDDLRDIDQQQRVLRTSFDLDL